MGRLEAEEYFSQTLKPWHKLTAGEQEFLYDRLMRFLGGRQWAVGWSGGGALVAIVLERD